MRTLAIAILLYLSGCASTNVARPASGQTEHYSIEVNNQSPFDMALYISPRHARIGQVGANKKVCVTLRGVGAGDLVIYAQVFGSGLSLWAPAFNLRDSANWRWNITTVSGNDLRKSEPCGQKRT